MHLMQVRSVHSKPIRKRAKTASQAQCVFVSVCVPVALHPFVCKFEACNCYFREVASECCALRMLHMAVACSVPPEARLS